MKSASIGAAAIGAFSFLPRIASADNSTCPQTASTPGLTTAPAAASTVTAGMPAANTPLVLYVDNPASGQGVIFVGEQRFDLNNPALIQALTAAIA